MATSGAKKGSCGKKMSPTPAVLLDCDGVIVDNLLFEQRVTDLIIEHLANKKGLSVFDAKAIWNRELRETKGDALWYDYVYHCNRLGLKGEPLVRDAHEGARKLLIPVPGAQETLRLLKQQGFTVGVVTDATSWVVRFKLGALDLDQPSIVLSSSEAGTTKATPAYWEKLSEILLVNSQPVSLVDNRQINLVAAHRTFPEISLVRFVMDEHITTLSRAIAPESEISTGITVNTVHSHKQLRSWFLHNQPELV